MKTNFEFENSPVICVTAGNWSNNKPKNTKISRSEFKSLVQALVLNTIRKTHTYIDVIYYPEMDLTPAQERTYVKELRQKTNGPTILVTFSPMIITDFSKGDVYVYSGKTFYHPEFQTFGASNNLIRLKMFGVPDTVGAYAKGSMSSYRNKLQRVQKGPAKEELLREIYDTFGDSVERTLLFAPFLED